MPPSIQGQNGSADLMAAARVVVWGFALGASAGFDLLWDEFNPHCEPMWSAEEMMRACERADDSATAEKPRGWLLDEDRGDRGGRGSPSPSAEEVELAREGFVPADAPAVRSASTPTRTPPSAPAPPVAPLAGLGTLGGTPPPIPEREPLAEGAARDTPPSELIVNTVNATYELFVDEDGTAYASRDRITAEPMESKTFRNELINLYRRLLPGAVPGSEVIKNATSTLVASASNCGARPVYIRTAFHGGKVYVQTDRKTVYEIDAAGWRETKTPPVRFRWPKNSQPLPAPEPDADIEELRAFANLEDDDQFTLIVCWLTAAIRGAMAVPILTLLGNQGTAKSTLARLLLSLIDPRSAELRSQPEEVEQLMIAARNAWILAYDNLSFIGPDMADAFCRLVTGGSLTRRALYTDADESSISARRPVIINGIEEPSTRGDLLERMLIVRLKPITSDKRTTEARLFAEFAMIRPAVIGALFDLVSKGLRNEPHLREDLPLPRLADFGRWLAAVIGEELAIQRLSEVNHTNAQNALDGNPIVPSLLAMLAELTMVGNWTGTPSELYEEVSRQARLLNQGQLPTRWPSMPHHLTGMIRRIAPQLEQIERWVFTTTRNKRERCVRFQRLADDAR